MDTELLAKREDLERRDVDTRNRLLKEGRLYGAYDEQMQSVHAESPLGTNKPGMSGREALGGDKTETSCNGGIAMKITGKFEVTLLPMDSYAKGADGINMGRMSVDKRFEGDLDATSRGEMLSALTPIQGSAGYVAIEQVFGQLSGKKGSFVLQHFGMMNRGKDRLVLEVVPDSGTGELAGLAGTMSIAIEGGQHFYEFEYALA